MNNITEKNAPGGFRAFTVRAETDSLDRVNGFIESMLEEAGCGMKAQLQVALCVEEIFVNIANYAYKNGIGDAEILSKIEDGVLTIVFKDSGIPYNPLLKDDPDITLSAEQRKIGGLGVFLVKKNADNVSYAYEDGKNILTLTKKIL